MNQSYDPAATASIEMAGMNLQAFNHLILQHQDEAYTLAFDLLGDETLAEEVLERVFNEAFAGRKRLTGDFRMEILRQVVQTCLHGSYRISGPKAFARSMASLSGEEKLVLVLVDCLGLEYADAAMLLGKSPANLSKSLAKARVKMNTSLLSLGSR
jgi:DNA-directed RNA polymerase specialized sigma24 family protein